VFRDILWVPGREEEYIGHYDTWSERLSVDAAVVVDVVAAAAAVAVVAGDLGSGVFASVVPGWQLLREGPWAIQMPPDDDSRKSGDHPSSPMHLTASATPTSPLHRHP